MPTFPLVFPIVFATTGPWMTAGDIINKAAVRVGLAAVEDPYASGDANFVLLRSLLEEVGQDLYDERVWTQLLLEYAFTTVQGTATYALPAGFGFIVNQTGWDRTNRYPLGGPLTPSEWAYLKGVVAGVSTRIAFRPLQGQLQIYPDTDTPGGRDIRFDYVSKHWVQTATAMAPDKEAPDSTSDLIWFDHRLVIAELRTAFLEERGLERSAAERRRERLRGKSMGNDSPSRVLRLGNQEDLGEPLLSDRNLPVTLGG